MLLRNPHIKKPVFRLKLLRKAIQTGASLHRCSDCANPVILLCQPHQFLPKYRRKIFRRGLQFPTLVIKFPDAMEGRWIFFRIGVAFPLDRIDMDQNRLFQRFCTTEGLDQEWDVMPVHRTEIVKAKVLEHVAVIDGLAQQGLRIIDHIAGRISDQRDFEQRLFHRILELGVPLSGAFFRKIPRQTAHTLGNRHMIVIEHHNQAVPASARVVKRFIDHPAGERTISHDRNHMVPVPCQGFCLRKSIRRRNRCTCMSPDECVILAFARTRESRNAAFLADFREILQPTGQELMGIALMANIPDNLILRQVKNSMQSDCKLHRPQI